MLEQFFDVPVMQKKRALKPSARYFATDAIRERCRELRILVSEPTRDLPSIEHFNIDENGVRILDRTIANGSSNGRIIDVYFKQDRVARAILGKKLKARKNSFMNHQFN